MTPARVKNPIIPGNPKDRTGTAGILRRAVADINRRFAGLTRDVQAIFARVPVYAKNDTLGPQVVYGMTPQDMEATSQALQEAVERWITKGRDASTAFWWDAYDEETARMGTAQTVANLGRLSDVYAAARTLQTVLFSEPYRNRLAMAQLKSYDHWTGLGTELRAELSQIIGRAVVDGKNPRAVRTEIAERLDVSRARAALYAQTDITDTLRQARAAEADAAEALLGLKIALLWTSAFLPTTRPWHGSRHGQVYTTKQVREFYAVNGNRYRCHCATTECLLNAEGKPILTSTLKSAMAKEKAAWQKANLGT